MFFFSVDMLNDDQIHLLMLDKAVICEQVLGTPITEVVPFIQDPGTAGEGSNK